MSLNRNKQSGLGDHLQEILWEAVRILFGHITAVWLLGGAAALWAVVASVAQIRSVTVGGALMVGAFAVSLVVARKWMGAVTLSAREYRDLLHVLTSELSPEAISDALVHVRSAIQRRHILAKEVRVELYVLEPHLKVLVAPSAHFMCGWTADAAERILPIPGLTPNGGTSVAGDVYVTGKAAYVPDGLKSGKFYRIGDSADQHCGESRSVLVVPIGGDIERRIPPLGVLCITSSKPNQYSALDLVLLQCCADVIAVCQPRGFAAAA